MTTAESCPRETESNTDTVFSDPTQNVTLKEMILGNTAETASGFLCIMCGSIVKSKRAVHMHVRDQHFAPNLKYLCPMCKKVYKNKNSFSKHISLNHRDLKGLNLDAYIVRHDDFTFDLKQE